MRAKPPAPPNHRLRLARLQRGWSQEQLAEQLNTNAFTISRWEQGRAFPRPYFRQRLAALFALPPEELGLLPAGAEPVSSPQSSQPNSSPAMRSLAAEGVQDPLLPLRLPASGLVGRDALLAQVKARLLAGETSGLAALQGLPGVGKTALALALAADPDVRARFADGVLWAGLGQASHVQETLARWGTVLRLDRTMAARLSTTPAWAQALRSAIGSRRLLIVLDDAWRLEDALACQVGGPNSAHVLTTRSMDLALRFAGEGATSIPELSVADGLLLLSKLAPQAVEAEPEEAMTVVRAVGSLPLGLVVLGRYLQRQAYSRQPRRLRAALELLHQRAERLQLTRPQPPATAHASPSLEAPLSLRASIALSYTALGPRAQAMLQALALFPPKPNSFSEAAALAVADDTGKTLDTLVDAGLVESAGAGRYHLHQTIVDFASLEPKHEPPLERLAAFFVQYVEAHHQEASAIEQDLLNILGGLEAAFTLRLLPLLVRGVTSLAPFLLAQGLYTPAETHLLRAQQAVQALGDAAGLAAVSLHLGDTLNRQGEYARAETVLQEGLLAARQNEQHDQASALLARLGVVVSQQGKHAQAATYFQEGLVLARSSENQQEASTLLRNLGVLAARQGHLAEAEAYFKDAAALARQSGQRDILCTLLMNLGAVAAEQGNTDQGQIYFQESFALSRELGQREGICIGLDNLGQLTLLQRRYAEARAYFEESLALARELGQRERICGVLQGLGQAAYEQEELALAARYLQESLTLAREVNQPFLLCVSLRHWGEVQLRQRRIDEAAAAFTQGLALARALGSQVQEAHVLFGLARVAAAQGTSPEAQRLGQESLQRFEASGFYRAAEVQAWLAELSQPAIRAREQATMAGRALLNGKAHHASKPQ